MSERLQAVLHLLAALLLAELATYLFAFTVRTVQETRLYGSLAQTPWAPPLIYPQLLWLVAMGVFALTSVVLAVRAALSALRLDWKGLQRDFGPETVEEELEAELSDLEAR